MGMRRKSTSTRNLGDWARNEARTFVPGSRNRVSLEFIGLRSVIWARKLTIARSFSYRREAVFFLLTNLMIVFGLVAWWVQKWTSLHSRLKLTFEVDRPFVLQRLLSSRSRSPFLRQRILFPLPSYSRLLTDFGESTRYETSSKNYRSPKRDWYPRSSFKEFLNC